MTAHSSVWESRFKSPALIMLNLPILNGQKYIQAFWDLHVWYALLDCPLNTVWAHWNCVLFLGGSQAPRFAFADF